MDVVVAGSMGDQELSLEAGNIVDRRGGFVALAVFVPSAHVPLRVNGGVLAPVSDGSAGKANLEIVTGAEHQIEGHVAAVAPAPHADTRAIHEGKRAQIGDAL